MRSNNKSTGRINSGFKSGGPKSDRSGGSSDNSAKRIEPRKNLMSVAKNNKFVLNTRTINRPEVPRLQSDPDQSVDDKINALQSLLRQAKGGN